MATAIPALEWESLEVEVGSEPEEITYWQDVPRASARLLEVQRRELEAEVEQAKRIRQQAEADRAAIYSDETIDRAAIFLKMHIGWLWQSCGIMAPLPMIGPGPQGSVDLYWRQASWKLLVNIPEDPSALVTFYGDDYGRQKTKGRVDPNKVSFNIAAFLMEPHA